VKKVQGERGLVYSNKEVHIFCFVSLFCSTINIAKTHACSAFLETQRCEYATSARTVTKALIMCRQNRAFFYIARLQSRLFKRTGRDRRKRRKPMPKTKARLLFKTARLVGRKLGTTNALTTRTASRIRQHSQSSLQPHGSAISASASPRHSSPVTAGPVFGPRASQTGHPSRYTVDAAGGPVPSRYRLDPY